MTFARAVTAHNSPDRAARAAHRRAFQHISRCPKVPQAWKCERCDDLEADAMRLTFRAELLSARGEALVALRAGATGT